MYLVKVDGSGDVQFMLQGLSISRETGGSDLLDIASFDSNEIFISVNIKDSLIVNIATSDSLIEAQTIIYGSDFSNEYHNRMCNCENRCQFRKSIEQ